MHYKEVVRNGKTEMIFAVVAVVAFYPEFDYAGNTTSYDGRGFVRSGFTTVGERDYGDRIEQRIAFEVPSVKTLFVITASTAPIVGQTICILALRRSHDVGESSFDTATSTFPWFRDENGRVPCVIATVAADSEFTRPLYKYTDSIVRFTGDHVLGRWMYQFGEAEDAGVQNVCLGYTTGPARAAQTEGHITSPKNYGFEAQGYYDDGEMALRPDGEVGLEDAIRRGRRFVSSSPFWGWTRNQIPLGGAASDYAQLRTLGGADPLFPSTFDTASDLPTSTGLLYSASFRVGEALELMYEGKVPVTPIPAIELVLFPCRDRWADAAARIRRDVDDEEFSVFEPESVVASREDMISAVPDGLGLEYMLAADTRTPDQLMDPRVLASTTEAPTPAIQEASNDDDTLAIVGIALAAVALAAVVVAAAVRAYRSNGEAVFTRL